MIRDATVADAPQLAAILRNWIVETGWMPLLHTPEDDLDFLSHLIQRVEMFVAVDPDAVGFLALHGEQVDALYLAPAARGAGNGKALLDQAKAMSPLLSLWTFEANPRAIAFYLREGFVVVERTDGQRNDENLPDQRMVWERTVS